MIFLSSQAPLGADRSADRILIEVHAIFSLMPVLRPSED